MTTSVLRQSKSSAVLSVTAGTAVAATVIAGRSRGSSTLAAVPAPAVPRPEDCPDLDLPVEMVPFTQHLRFRTVDDNAPLSGGQDAVLTCWASG